MAVTIGELRMWLDELEEDGVGRNNLVGVDDGGLSLVVVETGDYYEVGGVPEDCE